MAFDSIRQMIDKAENENKPLWEIILESDLQEHGFAANDDKAREASISHMRKLWNDMKTSSRYYSGKDRSNSRLAGGDAEKLDLAMSMENNPLLGGQYLNAVSREALKIAECNACMKRIVAAPTAGSCGVLPAVLIPLAEMENIHESHVLEALYVAAGFGQVIATRASISGAAGGCQAEVGSASAMAAAALVWLRTKKSAPCGHAAAMALSNLLGLVCDPVAGLVEIPCVQRNVTGAVSAVACANMALAGIECRIPVDEVIDAMGAVGDMMHPDLKETGMGGLAATPTGKRIAKEVLKPVDMENL